MRAWEDFLKEIDRELGTETVNKWLRPLKILRFDACNLYLESEDSFKVTWFEEQMRHKVQTRLVNNNGKPIKIHLRVTSAEPSVKPSKKITPTPRQFSIEFDELDNSSDFDSYFPSKANLLAYKLLQEASGLAAQASPLSFNPIYLSGRSGSGKSHLMMAAAAQLKKKGAKVIYVRAETFTQHVVGAIRNAEMRQFRAAYRHVDALLVDDIEIFARKGATQEELFHTFNALHTEGKQIILSASCPPQDLKLIEPRLVSRFEWGIVIPLQMPPKEQMIEILKSRAARANFPLDESLFQFLLDTFGHHTKRLTRALEALQLRAHLNQTPLPLTLEKAQHYLADMIQEQERDLLTPGKIIRSVAEFHGIKMEDILSKSQARECAVPRQIAMHLCREELGLPYMKIGDIFFRDHSTVMASVKQIQRSLEEKNPETVTSMRGIKKLLEV